jgi:alkylated DNA repair dioxygenase AlkB
MLTIHRDVAGIPGLDLALDCFTEDAERRLFEDGSLFEPVGESAPARERHSRGPVSPAMGQWSPDLFRLCNLVSDAGLVENPVFPDYCIPLSYPVGAGFAAHFDSRYRWGEAIVGVSLGQSCVLFLQASSEASKRIQPHAPSPGRAVEARIVPSTTSNGYAVEVTLPRRSIYVLRGAARYEYKHGIRAQTARRLDELSRKAAEGGEQASPPWWNRPHRVRRSLTFRATKAYSDAALEDAKRQALATSEASPSSSSLDRIRLVQKLQERIDQQSRFPPQADDRKLNRHEVRELRERGRETHAALQRHPLRHARFPSREGDGRAPTAVTRTATEPLAAAKTNKPTAALGSKPAAAAAAAPPSSREPVPARASTLAERREAHWRAAEGRRTTVPRLQPQQLPDSTSAMEPKGVDENADGDDESVVLVSTSAEAKPCAGPATARRVTGTYDNDDDSSIVLISTSAASKARTSPAAALNATGGEDDGGDDEVILVEPPFAVQHVTTRRKRSPPRESDADRVGRRRGA